MSYWKSLIVVLGLSGLNLYASASATPPIATYSMEKVVSSLKEGKEIEGKLKDYFESKQKEIVAEQEKIKKMQTEYDGQRKYLNEEKRAEKEKQIRELMMGYQEKGVRYQNEINQMREDLLKPVREKVFQLAAEMAKDKSAIMAYDKGEPLLKYAIPYVANEIDLNESIIEAYNKKFSSKK